MGRYHGSLLALSALHIACADAHHLQGMQHDCCLHCCNDENRQKITMSPRLPTGPARVSFLGFTCGTCFMASSLPTPFR